MPKGILKRYPGGLKVLHGGTRRGIKLNRPWQLPIKVDPTRCPFCKGEGKVIKTFPNGWLHLENLFTPHNYHTMVIPKTCWPGEKLKVLGGKEEIRAAFKNIASVVATRPGEVWLQAYIGASAGQNISHLHYHIDEPVRLSGKETQQDHLDDFRILKNEQQLIASLWKSPLVLFENWSFRVVVESIFRAGQCFFMPPGSLPVEHPDWIGPLAGLLATTVAVCARAFKSEDQGLAPDFQIFAKFEHGQFCYASYLPILNHHGSTESVGAILSAGPFIHPWSSEETLDHLKKFF